MPQNKKGAHGACDTEDAQAIRRSESHPMGSVTPAQQLQQIFAVNPLSGTETPYSAPWEISPLAEVDLRDGQWVLRVSHPCDHDDRDEVAISPSLAWRLIAAYHLTSELEKGCIDPLSKDRIRWARKCERRAVKLANASVGQTLLEREVRP